MKFFDLLQRIIQSIWAENAAHCNSEKQRQIQRDSGMGWVAQSPMCKLCQLLTSAAFCWLSSQWGLLPVQCASLQMPPVVLFPEEIAQHGPICKELFKESSGGGKKEGRKKKRKTLGCPVHLWSIRFGIAERKQAARKVEGGNVWTEASGRVVTLGVKTRSPFPTYFKFARSTSHTKWMFVFQWLNPC